MHLGFRKKIGIVVPSTNTDRRSRMRGSSASRRDQSRCASDDQGATDTGERAGLSRARAGHARGYRSGDRSGYDLRTRSRDHGRCDRGFHRGRCRRRRVAEGAVRARRRRRLDGFDSGGRGTAQIWRKANCGADAASAERRRDVRDLSGGGRFRDRASRRHEVRVAVCYRRSPAAAIATKFCAKSTATTSMPSSKSAQILRMAQWRRKPSVG